MVTTTKQAAHIMAGNDPQLHENASAKLARKQAEARAAAEALNEPGRYQPADTTTPLKIGKADLADVPEPPKAVRPIIVLSTTVAYRGRIVTISNDGMTLDQFCDLLDKKFGVAE